MNLRHNLIGCALAATIVASIPSPASATANCNCASTESATELGGTVTEAAFYSVQLLNQGGGNYNVHVYDATYDAAAFGRIQVTNCQTGDVILDQTFDSSIGNYTTPGSIDVPVVIAVPAFQVTLTTRSIRFVALFGNDQVYLGNPPTSQLNTQTRCYVSCDCTTFASASVLGGTVAEAAFYSVQLLNQGGGNYNVHVYDATYDAAAFGRIKVTDCQTGDVIVDQAFDSSIGNYTTPGSIDVPVVITAQFFTVELTTQEYSASSLFFGNDQVYLGNPPTSQLNTQIRCYEPVIRRSPSSR